MTEYEAQILAFQKFPDEKPTAGKLTGVKDGCMVGWRKPS